MLSLILLAAVANFFVDPSHLGGRYRNVTWIPGVQTYATSPAVNSLSPRVTGIRTVEQPTTPPWDTRPDVPGVSNNSPPECNSTAPRDCEDILRRNSAEMDGVYWVCPGGLNPGAIKVRCDMQGLGWTMLLSRYSPWNAIPYSDWNRMKQLLGNIRNQFWFGLEPVYRLTTSGNYSLMIEIYDGPRTWTEIYNRFSLSGEAKNYRLRVRDFDRANSTNTVPALSRHIELPFSTSDRDNTGYRVPGYCTSNWKGPGWFNPLCGIIDTASNYSFVHPFGIYDTNLRRGIRMRWNVDGRDIYPTELIMKIKRTGS